MPPDNAANADRQPQTALAPPPRRVPLTLQVDCLCGGTKSCLWFWLFLGALGVGALLEGLPDRWMVAWAVVGLVVFGAVTALGLLLVIASVREGLQERRLLVHGRFAVGRVTGDESLNPKCSRLSLEVTDDCGEALEVRGTAYWDDFEEPRPTRRLLYNPAQPDNALLLDNGGASNPPQLDGRGGFRRPDLADLAVSVALPLLVLLVPVRSIVVAVIRLVTAGTE